MGPEERVSGASNGSAVDFGQSVIPSRKGVSVVTEMIWVDPGRDAGTFSLLLIDRSGASGAPCCVESQRRLVRRFRGTRRLNRAFHPYLRSEQRTLGGVRARVPAIKTQGKAVLPRIQPPSQSHEWKDTCNESYKVMKRAGTTWDVMSHKR